MQCVDFPDINPFVHLNGILKSQLAAENFCPSVMLFSDKNSPLLLDRNVYEYTSYIVIYSITSFFFYYLNTCFLQYKLF